MKTPSRWIVLLAILSLLGSGAAPAQRVTGRGSSQAPSARPAPAVRSAPAPRAAPSYRPSPSVRSAPSYRPAPAVRSTPTYRPAPAVRSTPSYRPATRQIAPQVAPRQVAPRQVAPRPAPQRVAPRTRPAVRPVPQVQPQRQVAPRVTPSRTQPNATPSTRPAFKPATRPGSTTTPAVPRTLPQRQQEAIRPMPQVAKVEPLDSSKFNRFNRVPTNKPSVTPRQQVQTSPAALTRRPVAVGFNRPDGKPGRVALSRPVDRTGVLARPAVLDPGVRQKWGNWGKWSPANRQAAVVDAALINRNYRCAVNWSYRPNCWGANPWWTARACHRGWYRSHWNYCWSPTWYRRCYTSLYPAYYPGYNIRSYPVSWGLACWGLGSLAYDTGYYVYSNPYTPEPYTYESTVIDYAQPMSVISREYTSGDEIASNLSASRSADMLERSRSAFRDEDYLTALKHVDEAISYQPGDSALHEYRALVLFALGKYGDAAGVLHPLLASGPGWDRETMTGLYGREDAYLAQLGKLEKYVAATPEEPAPRFLLGYHYLVGGELDRAAGEFDEVSRLKPDDSISRQLRDLARSSVKTDSEEPVPPPAAGDAGPAVEAPSATQLVGTWRSNRAEHGLVTLSLRQDAGFTWSFTKEGAAATELTGTWEINDRGMLVLSSENAQMVGEVKFSPEQKMTFILAGGPEGDPGLTFDREP